MKQLLHSLPQRRLMLSACMGLMAALASNAPAQSLVLKWQNSSVGATANRDMAYNPATGNILLVKTTPTIVRLQSSDGLSAGADMDMTGVSGGQEQLRGIAVQADGTIWACNYVLGASASQTFKIYKWESETNAPTTEFTIPPTIPGVSADRFGSGLSVLVIPGVSTNLLIGGTAANSMLVTYTGAGYAFKLLTTDSQTAAAGFDIIDYNAPGFANKVRVIAKSRQTGGQIYNFDPTAAGPINITVGKTTMGAPWTFVANGIHTHSYNPVSKLIGASTSTLQAAPGSYTNLLFSTASSLSSPAEVSRVTYNGLTTFDGGAIGGTEWGTDGRLYASVSTVGAGVHAYDLTPFVITSLTNVIGIIGDPSATFGGAVFGGSSLTYQWKSNGVDIVDSSKYAGATTANLTISNLVTADSGTYTLYVTGVNSSFTTSSATLTVNNGPIGPKTWSGGDVDDNNWSSPDNWGGSALNFGGDTAFFAGSTRLAPVMDGPYDLSGLTFNPGAGAFNITASSGTLTLGGGLTNLSSNEQTLSLPISLSGVRTVDATVSSIVVSNAIAGTGGITKVGTNSLKLRGTTANTFAGALAINGGSVVFGKTPGNNAAAGTISMAAGARLVLEASDQIADTSLLNLQTSGGTLELLSGVSETIRGFPAGGLNVGAVSGNVELGPNAHFTIAPTLTVGDSAVAITAASPVGTKFIVSAGGAGSEIRFTPTNMVNTFEKVVIINGGKMRCGHGGNSWAPPETMLGAVPASFMQDQICITNGLLGLNGLLPIPTVMVHPNRGMTIAGNATNETIANVVFPGKITGPGTLWHAGGAATAPGNVELQGLNDFSGGLKLLSGAVIVNNQAAVGSGPIAFLSNAGRLAASANGIVITNYIDLSAFITNSFGLVNDFEVSGDVNLGNTGSDPQINVTNAANTVTFSGRLTNILGLVKNGAGRVSLTGNNNDYSGQTTIIGGTLLANNNSGSATSAGTVTVEPAGTLGGNGIVGGSVTVNGTVSPGNSVGTLTTSGESWSAGGHYHWEMNDATGTAGSSPGWDKLVINGSLNIASGPGSEFVIDITSLAGAVAGNAANFNNTLLQSWTIVTTTGGITGFSPDAFKLVTTGFSNPLGGAHFEITTSLSGNDIVLRLLPGAVGTGTGLIGAYYNSGSGPSPTSFPDPAPLIRLDPTINFDWGNGSPDPSINANNFVVRWSGEVQPFYSEAHTFIVTSDDGARLWVDGQLLIDDWIDSGPVDVSSTPVNLVGGQKYRIMLEYYENAVGAVAKLNWSTPGRSKEIIPMTQLYPSTKPTEPTLTSTPDHSQITLTWVGTFVLQSATDVTGPWTTVGAGSPYTINVDQTIPRMFFRLVSQ